MAVLIQYANGVPGVKFSLDKQVISIGRSIENDICISDSFVSKYHAVIEIIPNSVSMTNDFDFVLYDLKSTNSTYINSRKVETHALEHEDILRIGENEFHFIDSDDSSVSYSETDVLSRSMLELIPSEAISALHDAATVGMSDIPFDANDNHNLLNDKNNDKSQPQFSRRLNIF